MSFLYISQHDLFCLSSRLKATISITIQSFLQPSFMLPIRPLKGISSKATQHVLAQLTSLYEAQTGQAVHIESVGGVDAAKRVVAGEAFDVVLLASDAIDKLIASGHLAAPRCDWARSAVALAVPSSHAVPDISTDAALKTALLAAPSVSYSTGPSGVFLAKLFESWGIADAMAAKLIVPPPGVPVGSLVASGQAVLGFQQRSELLGVEGITLVGDLQGSAAYITTFSAGVAVSAAQTKQAADFLAFLTSVATKPLKLAQGML
jgi:molybdate transport system substrate-binding protein